MSKIKINFNRSISLVEEKLLVALIGNIFYPLNCKCSGDGNRIIITKDKDCYQLGGDNNRNITFIRELNQLKITDRYNQITNNEEELLISCLTEIFSDGIEIMLT